MKLSSILQKYAHLLEGLRLNLFGGSLRETTDYLRRQQNENRP